MRYTLTATALSAALLMSTAAYAANPEKAETQAQTSAQATIDSLPDSGTVSLSGVVDKVEDNKSFILRDSAGETIRVQAASEIDVNEGDRVSVRGEKSSKVAGLGEEITSASITASAESDMSAAAAAGAAAAGAAAGAARTAASDATESASPYATRKSADEAKSAASSYTREGARTGEQAAAGSKDMSKQEMAAKDTIDSLPREGSVELSGVVEKVNDDKTFILRDAEGKTIDIHTASNVEVRPGDMVSVNGNVKSKLLGLGREIESAKVLVVSAAE